MDELLFANPGWPKVTSSQERPEPGRLASYHCEMATQFG